MTSNPSIRKEKTSRGIAGTALILLIIALVALSLLRFAGTFERTVPITVISDRVGLVMDQDAKVKARGVEIGKVADIRREADHSVIELAVRRDELRSIPANAPVHIGSNTVFGAKSVEFEMPDKPSSDVLQEGQTIPEASVTTEMNSLFEKLTDTLQSVHPEQLNATLGALSRGLNDRGEDLGLLMADLNKTLKEVNPNLETLERDLDKGADVATIYADASPDIMRMLDSGTDVGQIVVNRQSEFEALLANAISMSASGNQVLTENGDNIVKLMRDLRATTSLLAEYSPSLNCMIIGLNQGQQAAGAAFGAEGQPGLSFLAGFSQGAKPYKFPDDLPKVNSSTGPNCYGLPYADPNNHAPYLVTDNGSNVVAGQPNVFDDRGLDIGPVQYAAEPGMPAPPSVLQFMLGRQTVQYAQPTDQLIPEAAPDGDEPADQPAPDADAAPEEPAPDTPGGGQ